MKALVISVRGFHLGYLGCYGNEWIATQALDRLAADGVVFDHHIADVPEAGAARRAWRSGNYQLPAFDGESAAPSGHDLVEELRRQGVRTVLVADGSRPLPEDFTAGWDHVEVVRSLADEATFLEQTLETARNALKRLAWVDQWLLWVDLATLLPPWEVPADFSDPYFQDLEEEEPAEDEQDEPDEELETSVEEVEFDEAPAGFEDEEDEDEPLTPWFDPPPGFLDTADDTDFLRLQSSYAAAVTFVDAAVDALLFELAGLGLADDCLIVLTSDHGQALGEHGVIGPHRPWLYEELIHVPLLLRLPALAGTGESKNLRVSALTQPPDLMPTLLAAFGIACPEPTQGHNLLPLVRAEASKVRDYACSGLRQGEASEWCLRAPGWAFLLPGASAVGDPPRERQLYVKPDDRWEVNDVVQHHLERADAFEQTLKAFVAASRRPGPFTPSALRDVEAETASPS
jgi:arylsulfatase A-like enzyme